MRWLKLCSSLNILRHCLSLGLERKLTFPVLWPLLSFPNLLAYWVQHFHSIIFKDFKYSAGILPPPLALFVVMLPKAHLTLHFRRSGSRWVITPLWLSGSDDLFCTVLCILATSSQYLVLLLGPYHFCPLLSPSLHEMFPWYLIFLKGSLVFPILLFSSISLLCSLRRLSYLSLLFGTLHSDEYISFSPLPFASLFF